MDDPGARMNEVRVIWTLYLPVIKATQRDRFSMYSTPKLHLAQVNVEAHVCIQYGVSVGSVRAMLGISSTDMVQVNPDSYKDYEVGA